MTMMILCSKLFFTWNFRAEVEAKEVFYLYELGFVIKMSTILFVQDEIESVILVGGGTRVPKVQEILLKAVKK